jgi:hypothetical protein
VTWNPVATEITTGATDALLAVLALAVLLRLRSLAAPDRWKVGLWSWLLGLLALASSLGAVAHGIDISARARDLLWQPLYLALGLVVALFVVAAVRDRFGERPARRALPWLVAAGLAFYGITRIGAGSFLVFVAYEAAAMLAALLLYADVARRRLLAGAGWMVAGVALNLAAAAVQQSDALVRLGSIPLDHNGLFHLVQAVAILALARGLVLGLDPRSEPEATDCPPSPEQAG